MKELLIDFTSPIVANLQIVEGKSTSGRMLLKGKLQEAETLNGNNRRYPRETLQREIQRYIDGPIKMNNALGELDHPDSTIINLSNVSHNIKKIWWEGNDVWGLLELLNTPSGKIAQELVLVGIPLGISSRGNGSVRQVGEAVEVQDDFDLLCWDLVSIPSTNNAYMRLAENLSSNQIKEITKYSKINNLVTDILCNQTGICACMFS
jgi:hypothetical protein